jgi:ABC-type phosphate/phosphonate transport system ATPase subunit
MLVIGRPGWPGRGWSWSTSRRRPGAQSSIRSTILLSLRRSDGLTLLINEQSSKRVLKFADRIYVLRGGRIQLHDRASNLRDGKAILEAYFGFGEQPAATAGSAALGGVAE